MSTLLAILVVGLFASYIILIQIIRVHYFESMKEEAYRLSILFATFIVSYFLRLIYTLLLGSSLFRELIPRIAMREGLEFMLPLILDLCSIVSILVLHFKSWQYSDD